MHFKLLLEKSYRYIKVGILLHLMTLGELLLLLLIYNTILLFPSKENNNLDLVNILLACYLFAFPVFAQLDARSRYQNYKKLRDQFYSFGFRERILKPVLKSRCQRDAALVASQDLGFKNECTTYFRKHGYRWWHLLPDFFFSSPQFLFYPTFWITTFFVPGYRSRTDHVLLEKGKKREAVNPVT